MPPLSVEHEKVVRLRAAQLGGRIWAAVSTHPGEEEIVLDAHEALQGAPLLILAPRHPARGDDLAKLFTLQETGLLEAQSE